MLRSLIIENIALIDRIEVTFGSGLNILTGETGAGKSIIVGALGLVLGERISGDVVRNGAERAVIEAEFTRPDSPALAEFSDYIDGEDGALVLRRIITANGRSRAFINDAPVPIGVLASVGDLLVDLHGQHDHQALLRQPRHIAYLDNFGVDDGLLSATAAAFGECRTLEQHLAGLKKRKTGINERRDLLSFHIREIEAVNPLPGEEEELEQSERLQKAGERIHALAEQLNQTLYEGDGSVAERLAGADEALSALSGVDSIFRELAEQCRTARIAAEDVVDSLQKFVSRHEFDPAQLEFARERLGKFSLLKKKYGGSIEAVLQYLGDGKSELATIETLDGEIESVSRQITEAAARLRRNAGDLSARRRERAAVLERETVAVLSELGLPNASFSIDICSSEDHISRDGMDRVEFFISLNPGEPLKPLKDVASGGEISRIMLALKTVLAESDDIPVMIFDEIDNGVSGRIARVIGRNLLANAAGRQIICITHLPQIASMGERHYQVVKTVEGEHTRTGIQPLTQEERVREIAKLLGGETITETAVRSARELLETEP
ncbi:DNA repair protein RecN [bacterium]|nr:DNA repair protein RecN [bacterium]